MKPLSLFIVLIERRGWHRVVAWALATLALMGSLLQVNTAHAQALGADRHVKVARDLDDELVKVGQPKARWARDLNGVRYVQAIVVSNAADPDMADLRRFVLRSGGSVYAVHPAVHAITVQIKAGQVTALAQRSDVVSVTPNRATHRTASSLEFISGALTGGNVRTNSTKTSYSGLDGSGVGIAVLDSGVMKAHDAFLDYNGVTRVKRNVNMLNATLASWTTGVDSASSLMPGSTALANYEQAIANDNAATQDGYGHGTHVASVAAGRARYYASGTPDTTGIAPNANIYDVKVLGDSGAGTLSDALEGIQWVIYHAKEYNIRVLNVSLASNSTQTWQTDPLCIAVRSATAAGITVVVAAGNFGTTPLGQEVYGTISSPGNEPSAITVGAVNFHGTVGRGDDTVDFFSSRGPTRSSYVNASGVPVVDNLLKPDLVAPGNRIVGAAATTASSSSPNWNFLAKNYASYLVTPLGIMQKYPETQMIMSGTSIAAPAVSGAVALLLQANPGLTPPLIKAILQYSAQPLPNSNLLEQGAGALNVDGAVVLAKALRTDLATAINAGTIAAGDGMLADNRSMPTPSSTLNGSSFNWSRIVFAGGNNVVSGSALFTRYQPIWDPRITWAGSVVR
ncbi:MAG TPA: S8 family serine peptidase, partial [Burkholderiaceae bacterium]